MNIFLINKLKCESKHLLNKIDKLTEFRCSEKFNKLNTINKNLIVIQLDVMKSYYNVLKARIELLSADHYKTFEEMIERNSKNESN